MFTSDSRRSSKLYFPTLPLVHVDRISGFLEVVVDDGDDRGCASLAILVDRLQMPMDDLLPILEAVSLLEFGQVSDAGISLTNVGRVFADATIFRRRLLFREQVLENVPQIAFITRKLRQSRDCEQAADYFLQEFGEICPHSDLDQQFAITVEWGRYAELFEFNTKTKRLHLLPVKA